MRLSERLRRELAASGRTIDVGEVHPTDAPGRPVGYRLQEPAVDEPVLSTHEEPKRSTDLIARLRRQIQRMEQPLAVQAPHAPQRLDDTNRIAAASPTRSTRDAQRAPTVEAGPPVDATGLGPANAQLDRLVVEATAGQGAATKEYSRYFEALQHSLAGRNGGQTDELCIRRPLVYRHTYALAEQHGSAPLAPPDEQSLIQIEQLLQLDPALQRAERPSSLAASDLLFLDTETTGLSRAAGTIAFIMGVGGFWGEAGSFQVDQIVLHDPAREAEGLSKLATYLERARLLISFNGRTFDLPILRNRGLLNRLSLPFCAAHLDLLPWCRRHFRGRLVDCRLGTLEQGLLGFQRGDDLAGAEAPRVYQEYLQHGRFCEMERLLQHNLHDIATLPPLLSRVALHVLQPLRWAEDGEELCASGAFHLRRGNQELGAACLRRALELSQQPATRARALHLLARLRRQQNRREEAAALWEQYRSEFPRHNTGWIELAKYHEHTTKDLERALWFARSAPHPNDSDLQHRCTRLIHRLAPLAQSGT